MAKTEGRTMTTYSDGTQAQQTCVLIPIQLKLDARELRINFSKLFSKALENEIKQIRKEIKRRNDV